MTLNMETFQKIKDATLRKTGVLSSLCFIPVVSLCKAPKLNVNEHIYMLHWQSTIDHGQ